MTNVTAPEQSQSGAQRPKFARIDLLRFAAAFFVMLFHARFLLDIDSMLLGGETTDAGLVYRMVKDLISGPAAVMLFFVISGVCIHAAYRNAQRIDLVEFYLRRYLRIGIPMIVACIATVIVTRTWSIAPIPVWSLWCEAFYYLVYPFLVVLLRYVGFNVLFITALVVALVLCALPDDHGGLPWAYGPFVTWLLYLPVWLMGVWIVENASRFRRLPATLRKPWCLVAFACTLLGLTALVQVAPYHLALAPELKLALLLISFPQAAFIGLLISSQLKMGAVARFLDRQGAWSYSLYLVHGTIIVLSMDMLRWSGVTHFGAAGSLAVTIMTMLCACWTARLFYHFVEQPSHRLARQVARRSVNWHTPTLAGPGAPRSAALTRAPASGGD